MSTLKIGWSEVNITPEKKVALAGQFAERISQYVEKPITVTAMAVDSGDDQAIMCSFDLVNTPWNLLDDIRARLEGNTLGIDPQKLIFSAIHTHTGPTIPRRNSNMDGGSLTFRKLLESQMPANKKYVESAPINDDPDVIKPDAYYELLLDWTYEAVVKAWESRESASFSNAFGRAAVGMCRRATYSDGSAQMWGDTNTAVFETLEGGNDSGIELLFVFDKNKKLTGIVVNLACPAQCVQHRLFISPDFWGEVKVLLRKYFGEDLFVLAQCSAAGDQCPVDLVRWVEPESDVNDPNLKRIDPLKRKADPSMFDLAGMRKAGKRIAREIIDVYEEGLDEVQTDVEFTHLVQSYPLPIRRVTLADEAVAREVIKEYMQDKEGDLDFNDAAKLQIYLGTLRRFKLQEQMDIWNTEVHIIRMGTVAFATNPFELFLDFGNQIKARSKAEQTFLVQLANGAAGYLPTEKAEKGGHYSAFVSSGNVGHVGGEMLVRQTLTDIAKLFK